MASPRVPFLKDVNRKRISKFGPLLFPRLAKDIRGRNPVAYTNDYFDHRSWAPFLSPHARDWDLVVDSPLSVRVKSRNRSQVASAVETMIGDLAQYISTFLTHPRYGAQKEVGFARGDTVRPVKLHESAPGVYSFQAKGLAVGQQDLVRWLVGPSKDKQAKSPAKLVSRPGWTTFAINIPANPEGPGVALDEWYDFTPTRWLRRHPKIPLIALSVRIRPRRERFLIEPNYRELYRTGMVRVGLIFGYDFELAGHGFARDARDITRILTAPTSRRFTTRDSNVFGYHGPGLGFTQVDGSQSGASPGPGRPLVFRRDAGHGGAIPVRYRGSRRSEKINAEVRVYNFDKASRRSGQELITQFVSAFRDNQIIHYDGHANYGGGFYVGSTNADELWATDIGRYQGSFDPGYQIFSIGACHSAGYFADLFYNELKPRKTPKNLHIVASVNEQAYADAVHTAVDLVANLLQVDDPRKGRALSYEQLLMELNYPSSSSAYIGVFGDPRPRGH